MIKDMFTASVPGHGTRAQLVQAEVRVLVYLVQANADALLKEITASASQHSPPKSREFPFSSPSINSTADLRDYDLGAQIIYDLGVRKLRLVTSQHRRVVVREGFGIVLIDQVPIT